MWVLYIVYSWKDKYGGGGWGSRATFHNQKYDMTYNILEAIRENIIESNSDIESCFVSSWTWMPEK